MTDILSAYSPVIIGSQKDQNIFTDNYLSTSIHYTIMAVEKPHMSFERGVLKKLDKLRGAVPRSTFLSILINEKYHKTKEAKGSPWITQTYLDF